MKKDRLANVGKTPVGSFLIDMILGLTGIATIISGALLLMVMVR